MFSNLRLVHFHCSLSLYFDAKATRAFVAGLFVLLFVCTTPTTECVTIIPTNDLGHESKSQFNPSFCSHRPFLLRANPTWLIKTDPAFYLGLPSTSILQQSLWWWWWWWWWWYSFVFFCYYCYYYHYHIIIHHILIKRNPAFFVAFLPTQHNHQHVYYRNYWNGDDAHVKHLNDNST